MRAARVTISVLVLVPCCILAACGGRTLDAGFFAETGGMGAGGAVGSGGLAQDGGRAQGGQRASGGRESAGGRAAEGGQSPEAGAPSGGAGGEPVAGSGGESGGKGGRTGTGGRPGTLDRAVKACSSACSSILDVCGNVVKSPMETCNAGCSVPLLQVTDECLQTSEFLFACVDGVMRKQEGLTCEQAFERVAQDCAIFLLASAGCLPLPQ